MATGLALEKSSAVLSISLLQNYVSCTFFSVAGQSFCKHQNFDKSDCTSLLPLIND